MDARFGREDVLTADRLVPSQWQVGQLADQLTQRVQLGRIELELDAVLIGMQREGDRDFFERAQVVYSKYEDRLWVPSPEPDEATLRAHLESHPERWQVAPGVRFTHVFVGRERHGDATLADARALLARLVAGEDPASLGDPFLRGREVGPSSRDEIAAQFGAEFASRVTELPVGTWSGPVGSSYGLHLVRVEQRRPGGPPPLAEVREAVRHDWIEERRAEARRAKLDDLRRHYDLRGVP